MTDMVRPLCGKDGVRARSVAEGAMITGSEKMPRSKYITAHGGNHLELEHTDG